MRNGSQSENPIRKNTLGPSPTRQIHYENVVIQANLQASKMDN